MKKTILVVAVLVIVVTVIIMYVIFGTTESSASYEWHRPFAEKHLMPKTDSTLKALQQSELEYFMRVHDVQDEGYDIVANYSGLINGINPSPDTLREPIFVELATARQHVGNSCGVFFKDGRLAFGKRNGLGLTILPGGRCIRGRWHNDTITSGTIIDSVGTYEGQLNKYFLPNGHGQFLSHDSIFYEGHWNAGLREGFGFEIGRSSMRVGEWKSDRYRGERMIYTSERIYGIDISRYQHGKGRKKYPIHWNKLRINYMGKNAGTVDYPVSFVYIKSTEGTSVTNKFFAADYRDAKRNGFLTGAYHFYSTKSTGYSQARFFLSHTIIRKGDLPPVLDIEPTDAAIAKMGGVQRMFGSIRIWLEMVEQQTGLRPILYLGQRFVKKYLDEAPDIKQNYDVWIARYGEFKPDVHLLFWQLTPNGRVSGIHGEVDINVFNGYHDEYDKKIGKFRYSE